MPIDFSALTRGRRLAEQDRREAELYERGRRQYELDRQEQDWQREAAAYTAPILQHRVAATESGMSPTEFMVAQIQAIRNDQGFQNKAPEVQQRIMASLMDSATVQAQRASQAGNWDDANRLLGAIGQDPARGEYQLALDQGDPFKIIGALQAQGHNIKLEGSDVVMPDGSRYPAALFAEATRATGSPLSGYGNATRYQQEQSALAEQQSALQQLLTSLNPPTQGEESQIGDAYLPGALGVQEAPPAWTGAASEFFQKLKELLTRQAPAQSNPTIQWATPPINPSGGSVPALPSPVSDYTQRLHDIQTESSIPALQALMMQRLSSNPGRDVELRRSVIERMASLGRQEKERVRQNFANRRDLLQDQLNASENLSDEELNRLEEQRRALQWQQLLFWLGLSKGPR